MHSDCDNRGGACPECRNQGQQPQFTHRCDFDGCVFLGPFKLAAKAYDLYYCAGEPSQTGRMYPSLRARFANQENYNFETELVVPAARKHDLHPALWEAVHRARLKGLIE